MTKITREYINKVTYDTLEIGYSIDRHGNLEIVSASLEKINLRQLGLYPYLSDGEILINTYGTNGQTLKEAKRNALILDTIVQLADEITADLEKVKNAILTLVATVEE